MWAIGTNPNLPSRLRSSRYRVITGPLATEINTATVQHPGNSMNSRGAAVASPHWVSDYRARRAPAALFGPLHPAPGDIGCLLIQKL